MNTTHQFKGSVNAEPTKQFFVDMLTRDISLEDTVLDLLDNCHDGVLRTLQSLGKPRTVDRPYEGFFARITLAEDWFSIEDNCGGIPPNVAEDYAFRMGRDPRDARDAGLPTVGIYGIGMKRAIFKIGKAAEITSQYEGVHSFEVSIPEAWVTEPGWKFPIEPKGKVLDHLGTRIMVAPLHDLVGEELSGKTNFVSDLKATISRYYARILSKGFSVYINDIPMEAVETRVLVSKQLGANEIEPYVLVGEVGDVTVNLVCGFYRAVPTEAELDDEAEVRRSRSEAGWTVICNDRVVIYKDTTRLTGWGLGIVPNYHNQFICFSGVVELWSENAGALPLTTTKRGVDMSSDVYLEILEYMMTGTKQFTNFTNKWKGNEAATKAKFEGTRSVSAQEAVRLLVEGGRLHGLHRKTFRQAMPKLPLPSEANPNQRISFTKPQRDVERVSMYFFERPDAKPSAVGEQCFDFVGSREASDV